MFGPYTLLRRQSLRVLALSVTLSGMIASAAPPAWWSNGNPPIITGAPANNRGPANIGQTKWMVTEALRALDAAAPTVATQIRADLAGTAPSFADRIIDLAVPPNPKPAGWAEKQKAPLLIGQLKAISAPFYTRLNAAAPTWLATERTTNATNNPTSVFPWTPTATDDQNKAIATIGQLKAVFSLRVETAPVIVIADMDLDGMSDQWELDYGFDPNDPSDAEADKDGDGLTNIEEYLTGSDPESPRIHAFAETYNIDGTITYAWLSHAVQGAWFRIEDELPDGGKKTLFSTTYGSARLPHIPGSSSYTLTLDPVNDYIP